MTASLVDSGSEKSGEDEGKCARSVENASIEDLEEKKRSIFEIILHDSCLFSMLGLVRRCGLASKHRSRIQLHDQKKLPHPTRRSKLRRNIDLRVKPLCKYILRRFLFVSTYHPIREVVEVAEDSEDAKKWPLWKHDQSGSETTTAAPSASPMSVQTTEAHPIAQSVMVGEPNVADFGHLSEGGIVAPPSPTRPAKTLAKRPGPRKPKTTLAAVPGSSKPKKLTTLDKSAMDWRSHIQSEQESGSSIKDELDANRRGGGYLEKVEFLKRVEERKDEHLDALRGSKRRKL